MIHPVACSVPGKLILAGEHSVVFGRPALVAATDLRLVVEVAPSPSPGFDLRVPALDLHRREAVEVAVEFALTQRALWREYRDDPTPEHFSRLDSDDPLHLLRLAAAEAMVGMELGTRAQVGAILTVSSELPIGSGLGSSAALASAVIAGLRTALGRTADPPVVEAATQHVEQIQHGNPSGLDAVAVVRGGVLWRERSAQGGFAIERFAGPFDVLRGLVAVDSGRPPDSTGDVVSWVGDRHRRMPEPVDELLERLESGARGLRSAIEADAADGVRDAIMAIHAALTELGVVPAQLVEQVGLVERGGGAAKISGAGSLRGAGAGSLLVFHPEEDGLQAILDELGLPILTRNLGSEGLRLEPAGNSG